MSFVAIAQVGSFTRAAAQIGVSQSALSHAVRGLEERLGIRLLTRTTRKVTPTREGERLLKHIAPHFSRIQEELEALVEMRDKPAGVIRITATDHAAKTVIWPKLSPALNDYPDLSVEVVADYSLTDIVAEKFDAGVRLGEQLSEGMIAVRISPDFRMLVVGAPSYFDKHPSPKEPQQLTNYNCINLRLPKHGGIYCWEFEKDQRSLKVKVGGQFTFNSVYPVLQAALDGHGLGYLPEDLVREHINNGRLVSVLDEWCPPLPGYFFYYPSRRQISLAFRVIVEALQHNPS